MLWNTTECTTFHAQYNATICRRGTNPDSRIARPLHNVPLSATASSYNLLALPIRVLRHQTLPSCRGRGCHLSRSRSILLIFLTIGGCSNWLSPLRRSFTTGFLAGGRRCPRCLLPKLFLRFSQAGLESLELLGLGCHGLFPEDMKSAIESKGWAWEDQVEKRRERGLCTSARRIGRDTRGYCP